MSVPIFIHIMTSGDVWASCQHDDTPAGTIAATYRVNGIPALAKLGTISGTSPNYASSGANGKEGRDISGR